MSTPCPDPHRPQYHYSAAHGWINDPNGLCWHDGRYHLFVQHNPHSARWGRICWGHLSSPDLLQWQHEPLALQPSAGDDAEGCFSGSWALVDGTPTLYYTGYTTHRQVQCVATSSDLRHWHKQPQRTLAEPPPGVDAQDFRDPYVLQHDGWWYMVVGASLQRERGMCLLYRSRDGIDWSYRGPLLLARDATLGAMWECPNLLRIGTRWLLTVSIWPNLGAHGFVGRFEHERFIVESEQVLDPDGGAFAHLAFQAPDGRTLQWAWLNEQRQQSAVDAAGWAGALSVPRELGLDAQGRVLLKPAAELAALRQAPLALQPVSDAADGTRWRFSGRHLELQAQFRLQDRQPVGLTLLASPDGSEQTRIVYRPEARRLLIERARSSIDARASRQDLWALLCLDPDEPLQLRVLLDASVLEVYANERVCLSTRLYPALHDSVQGSAFVSGAAELTLQGWQMGALELLPARP